MGQNDAETEIDISPLYLWERAGVRAFVPTKSMGDGLSPAMEGFIVILNEVKNPNGRGKGRIPMQRFFPATVGILRSFTPQNDTSGTMLAPRHKLV